MHTLRIYNALNHWNYFLENEVGGGFGMSKETRRACLASGVRCDSPDDAPLKVEFYKWDDWAGTEGAYVIQSEKVTTFGEYRI